jgi:uncharacterized protein
MLELEAYLQARIRPLKQRPTMLQSWRHLAFLHFDCDPEELRGLLPNGLELDTFEDRAWVGLVPFEIAGLRPPRLPALPWISRFPETNVRTYVHHEGRNPGVWFFSLDAARWLACRAARISYRLPYKHASKSLVRSESEVRYRSVRRDRPCPAVLEGRAAFGKDLGEAEPGALEFFLIERYFLYAEHRGRLFQAQVHHSPYPLVELAEADFHTNLIEVAGIRQRPWTHAVGSPGVDVEVFPLRPAAIR